MSIVRRFLRRESSESSKRRSRVDEMEKSIQPYGAQDTARIVDGNTGLLCPDDNGEALTWWFFATLSSSCLHALRSFLLHAALHAAAARSEMEPRGDASALLL